MSFDAGAVKGRATLDTSDWMGGIGKMVKSMVSVTAIIGTVKGIGEAFTDSINNANEYQKSLSNIATITDASTVNMTQLSGQILSLSPALGNATELADAFYTAFSSGASTVQEATDVVVTAAKFGKSVLTDNKTAVDVLTTAINAYGKENMTAQRAADLFFTTIKDGKAEGAELAANIGQSIPLFASAGISLDQLSAGVATLTQVGVSAPESMTRLNGVVNAFIKPSEAMATALQKIGYTSGSAFLKAEGLTGALKFLGNETQGDSAKVAELANDIRAQQGIMALTGPAAKIYAQSLADMATSSGSVDKAFKTQEKTTATYDAAMKNLSLTVGNIGKAFTDEIQVGATDAATSIAAFLKSGDAAKIFATSVATISAGFTAIKEVTAPFVNMIGPAINKVFDALGKNLMGASVNANVVEGGITALSTVFTIGGGAVTAFSDVLVGVINTAGATIDALGAVGGVITQFFSSAMTGKWDELGKSVDNAGKKILKVGTVATTSFDTLIKNQEGVAKGLLTTIQNTSKNTQDAVTKGFQKTYKDALDSYKGLVTGTQNLAERQQDVANDLIPTPTVDVEAATQSMTAAQARLAVLMEEYRKKLIDDQKLTYDEQLTALDTFLATDVEHTAQYLAERSQIVKDHTKTILEDETKSYAEKSAAIDAAEKLDTENTAYYANLRIDLAKKELAERIKMVTDYSTLALNVFTAFGQQYTALQSQNFANDNAALQNDYNKKLAALDANLKAGIITQEEYDAKKEKLDTENKKKQNELAKKEFEAEKQNKIAGVWMSAAQSIAGWWQAAPQLGPIAGPIFASAMTAEALVMAGVQSSAIDKQQFVPAYAEGGTMRGNGLAWVNEQGPELQRLKDGTMVVPAELSRQIATHAGSADTNINVSFPGAQFFDRSGMERMADHFSGLLGRKLKEVRGRG